MKISRTARSECRRRDYQLLGETQWLAADLAGNPYSNPNVVTAQDQAFGVLKLSLHPDSYSWDCQLALTGPGFDPPLR